MFVDGELRLDIIACRNLRGEKDTLSNRECCLMAESSLERKRCPFAVFVCPCADAFCRDQAVHRMSGNFRPLSIQLAFPHSVENAVREGKTNLPSFRFLAFL